MRTIFSTLFCLLVCAASASAQGLPAGRAVSTDVGVGYAYVSHPVGQSNRFGLSGVDGNITFGFNPRFGIKADLGYAQSGDVLGTLSRSTILTCLAGPVFHLAPRARVDPYVQALFGGSRIGGPVPVGTGNPISGWVLGFAWTVGGGAEYRISDSWSLRAGVDYLRAPFFSPALTVQGQSNVRVTVGLGFSLAGHARRPRP
jgi:opacity protein-like surface antigen